MKPRDMIRRRINEEANLFALLGFSVFMIFMGFVVWGIVLILESRPDRSKNGGGGGGGQQHQHDHRHRWTGDDGDDGGDDDFMDHKIMSNTNMLKEGRVISSLTALFSKISTKRLEQFYASAKKVLDTKNRDDAQQIAIEFPDILSQDVLSLYNTTKQ